MVNVLAADGEAGDRARRAFNQYGRNAQGDVDGALVGGASLKAADFVPIIAAAAAVEG